MREYLWMDSRQVCIIRQKDLAKWLKTRDRQTGKNVVSLNEKIATLKDGEVIAIAQGRLGLRSAGYSCVTQAEWYKGEANEIRKLQRHLELCGSKIDCVDEMQWKLNKIQKTDGRKQKNTPQPDRIVFRNGQPFVETESVLGNKDWIVCWPYEFFVVDDCLWASFEHPFSTVNLGVYHPDPCGNAFMAPSLSREEFAIEPYLENRKTNTGMMSSPAGMIVISSLASVLSSWIVSPDQTGMVAAGLVSAVISGGAFAGWYGWQAHRRKVLREKDDRELLREYLSYLKKQIEIIETRRCRLNAQFRAEQRRLFSFDPSLHGSQRFDEWKLPAGISKTDFGVFKFPNLSWQLAGSNSQKALDQLADQPLDCWTFMELEQGGRFNLTSWRTEQILWLYLQWNWMVRTENRRFAWITKERLSLRHNGSMIDHCPLCFGNETEFFAMQSRYPNIEWTICSDQYLPESRLTPRDTVLYVSWPQSGSTAILPALASQPVFPVENRERSLMPIRESLFPRSMPPEDLWRKTSYPCASEKSEKDSGIPTGYRKIQSGWKERNREIMRAKRAALSVELCSGVYWDLKKEGPHALIAGATGSGKSEGLCSILYQLALQNSADLLQFVLIDFKGGSFLSPFVDLPHTAAILTNLDQQEIWRLERALNKELDRRQDAISQFLKSNPGSPTEIGRLTDPQSGSSFSEIIVVVDEFGQLKSRCPDFMKSLQEMARIGRSLSFHLILSTQKPAGIVDEQIWANSKSRLCFPVYDRMDSREVLGHEKASLLKKSGEFILQTDECEKNGRMFYLKRPFDGSSKIEVLDRHHQWQTLEQKTLQETMRELILERQEARHFLLVPDLKDHPEDFGGLKEDCLNHFSSYSLPPKKMHLCLASEHQIAQIACALVLESRIPVLANTDLDQTFRSVKPEKKQADLQLPPICQLEERALIHIGVWQKLSSASLWQLSLLKQEVLVLIRMNEQIPFELIEAFATNKWLTTLLMFDHVSFHDEKIFRFCSQRLIGETESRDQLSLISEGKLTGPQKAPVIRVIEPNGQKEQYQRLIIGTNFPPFQKKSGTRSFFHNFRKVVMDLDENRMIQDQAKGLIGIETENHKPVFRTAKPLVLCWTDENAKSRAIRLLQRFYFENRQISSGIYPEKAQIVLLDLSGSQTPEKDLKECLAEADLVFIGEGLSNYSYVLNLPYPPRTNAQAMWISKGRCAGITLASFRTFEEGEGG